MSFLTSAIPSSTVLSIFGSEVAVGREFRLIEGIARFDVESVEFEASVLDSVESSELIQKTISYDLRAVSYTHLTLPTIYSV